MKTRIVIFCGQDVVAAQAIASALRDGTTRVTLHDAGSFYGFAPGDVDRVIVMGDVPGAKRDAIVAAYGARVDAVAKPAPGAVPLVARHRGRGKYYVMRGREVVSGPFTKQQAEDEARRPAA